MTGAGSGSLGELMTTREAAAYLRLKERKVYDLVHRGAIPCTRVTGKWLFPRALIDRWLLECTEGGAGLVREPPPAVITGSHDPLLEWAAQASESGLALLFTGSLDGLARFAAGSALACGLHVAGPDDDNVAAAQRAGADSDAVVIEWARRSQGLMLAPGNPLGVTGLADLPAKGARLVDRQPGAGSHLLLDQLLADAGIERAQLDVLDEPAVNETDVARLVHAGTADAGLGIEAAAHETGLSFVPLASEHFDLLVRRRAYFEAPFQQLLTFARSQRLADRARALGGYDVSALGTVRYIGP